MEAQSYVLSSLGTRLGLDLSFGENEHCCLLLDQSLFISIENKASGWLFTGLVQNSVDWHEKSFWQDLLALNLSLAEQNAGSVAYEPTSDALLYIDSIHASMLNTDSAYVFLESFIGHLEKMIERVRAH